MATPGQWGRRGCLIVQDISQNLVAGWKGLRRRSRYQRDRDAIEYLIAVELLRAAPRFWSGAILSVRRDSAALGACEAEILCLDGYPAHASVTDRLWERIFRLMALLEVSGPPTSNVLIGVYWDGPRTWSYEGRYFQHPKHMPADSFIDQSSP